MTWYQLYMLHFTMLNSEGFQFDKVNFENKTITYTDKVIYYGEKS